MDIFILRIAFPAALTLLVTMLQRRMGHRLGGRVVGLPMTMFPLLLILLLTDGVDAAAQAALWAAGGQLGVGAFCLTYTVFAKRIGPLRSMLSALGTAMCTLIVVMRIGPLTAALFTLIVTITVLVLWKSAAELASRPPAAPWDAVVRVVATVTVVAALSMSAEIVGPGLAGLLAATPVVLSILTPATHRGSGAGAALGLIRGTVRSLPATVGFGLIVACAVQPLGGPLAFVIATAGLVTIDATTGMIVSVRRRTSPQLVPLHA